MLLSCAKLSESYPWLCLFFFYWAPVAHPVAAQGCLEDGRNFGLGAHLHAVNSVVQLSVSDGIDISRCEVVQKPNNPCLETRAHPRSRPWHELSDNVRQFPCCSVLFNHTLHDV